MVNPKKILVTGANGFIGSFIVEEALASGFEVWAAVRKSSDLRYLSDKRINMIELPYHDKEQLSSKIADFRKEFGAWDYVVHNLGATKVMNHSDFDKINFLFTQQLVDALIAADAKPEKFIFMSSLSVCGPFGEHSHDPIPDDFVPDPNTAYGKSKLKAEEYLKSLNGFPYMILRPTGVYGPRDKDYYLMIKTIRSGFDPSVGFRPQYLTFIYVKDLARAVMLAATSRIVGESYCLSDGKLYLASDFRTIVQKNLGLKRVLSVRLPLIFVKVVSLFSQIWGNIFRKPATLNGDKYKIMKQRNWNCSIDKAQKDLGYMPEYDLSRGLEENIRWYKEQNYL